MRRMSRIVARTWPGTSQPMKIRRKPAKPTRSGRPHWVIGYSAPTPSLGELQGSFELAYGGPLTFRSDPRGMAGRQEASPSSLATHGPWCALVRLPIPPQEAAEWRHLLEWVHSTAGLVFPTTTSPQDAGNLVLHMARLARTLTLLTEGTAYDTLSHNFVNPSDWQDRPLSYLYIRDHVRVMQGEAEQPGQDWFYTLGLTKFGQDEVEIFRPVGLPSQPVLDLLGSLAEECYRLGHSPKVGTAVEVPELGLSVQVLRHRTAAPLGTQIALREITWPGSPAQGSGL